MRTLIFPYQIICQTKGPIIPVYLQGKNIWLKTWAYVDSGASYSIFKASEAKRLGLNLKEGLITSVVVGDGSAIPVSQFILPVKLDDILFEAVMGFSEKLGIDFNLLGRTSFFEKFDVTFSESKNKIIFQEVK